MLSYVEIKNKIKEIYEEKDDLRVKLNWFEDRFVLEFGKEEWEMKFKNYLKLDKKIGENKCEWDKRLEEKLDDEKVFEFISKQDASSEEINKSWKDKPEEFIKILSRYRKNGSTDNNQTQQLMNFAKNINNDSLRYIYEIIQNADDCDYRNYNEDELPSITIDLTVENQMKVTYNEVGMTYSDIIALTTVGQSNKNNRVNKRLIGEKGIGFKTIFSACESVDIYSGGYKFKLRDNSFAPELIISNELNKSDEGTTLILKFPSEIKEYQKMILKSEEIYEHLKQKYGLDVDEKFNKEVAFKNCPVFFTEKIKSITVKKSKTENFNIKCDSDYKITYVLNNEEVGKIECYSFEKNVEFTFEEYYSRYKNQFTEDEFNAYKDFADKTAITYPIRIIAPKDTSVIKEGNMYSYLPTYTNIKAPFNIQLPIKLNLDRSSIWFIGDEDTDGNGKKDNDSLEMLEWNKRLFDEMFFSEDSLIKEMYEQLKNKENIFKYIPEFRDYDRQLFKKANKHADNNNSIERLNKYCGTKKLFEVFKNIPYFKINIDDGYCITQEAIMFDDFIHDNFYVEYYNQLPEDDKMGKYLVDFNKKAIEKAKCFGFKQFCVEDDKKKINYLNAVLKGKEINVLRECKKDDEISMYLPSDISALNIFPAKNTDDSIRYVSYINNLWFSSDGRFKSDNRLCFLNEELGVSGLLSKLKFMSCSTIEDVWDNINKKINQEDNHKWDKELFIEMMELVSKHAVIENKNDWYSYSKAILEMYDYENDNVKNIFWNETRSKNLVDLINDKIIEFIGGEKNVQ